MGAHQKKSRNKTAVRNLILVIVILLIAAGIILRITLHRAPQPTDKEQAEIDRNVAYIDEQAQDAGKTETDEPAEDDTPADSNERQPLRSFAEEKKYVLSMDPPGNETLISRFSGTAIVGDSMVDAIKEYGILDGSVVFSKIGVSISTAKTVIASMQEAKPYAVFFCFGLNDMELYESKVERFIEDYTECIGSLREKDPDADIYICGLSPVTDEAVRKTPAYANISLYNEKMEEMCETLDVTWLDPAFILENRPDLFDADGIHPKMTFYPRFLTFLADMAGLKNE